MIPIHKKGDTKNKANYRPISCLVTASKVMEKIIWEQVTNFIEENNILPKNQHGFRKLRSTMTAHANMQQDWIQNKEEGNKTGILIWDLTAAFDTIEIGLLCKKLELYGFSPQSIFTINFCAFSLTISICTTVHHRMLLYIQLLFPT